jgi:hypothetical protein
MIVFFKNVPTQLARTLHGQGSNSFSGNVYLSRVQRCRAGYSEYLTNVSAETFISQEFRDVERGIQNISPLC